jgi:uncharacterized protein Yka (UPF0111/DUF47 family)
MNTLTISNEAFTRFETLQKTIRNLKQLINRLEDELDSRGAENYEQIFERIEKLKNKVCYCEIEYTLLKGSLQ